MDDADNSYVEGRIDRAALLPGWCALAEPIVRSVSFALACRYGLQRCERQDLQQELWLELLLRRGGRNNDQLLRSKDAQTFPPALRSQLREEVQRIGVSLVWSWDLWGRLRAMAERYQFDPTAGGLIAGDARESHNRRDLSLDVICFVAKLPSPERSLCEAIMAGPSIPTSDDAQRARQLAALRGQFSTFIPYLR